MKSKEDCRWERLVWPSPLLIGVEVTGRVLRRAGDIWCPQGVPLFDVEVRVYGAGRERVDLVHRWRLVLN